MLSVRGRSKGTLGFKGGPEVFTPLEGAVSHRGVQVPPGVGLRVRVHPGSLHEHRVQGPVVVVRRDVLCSANHVEPCGGNTRGEIRSDEFGKSQGLALI